MMKKYILLIFFAFSGLVQAKDIPVEAISVFQLEKCLPAKWRIESINPVTTVSGWTKLNGSNGVRITISRNPYEQRYTRLEDTALAIPRFEVDVFPGDFEGKDTVTSAIFRQGKVTHSISPLFSNCTMAALTEFTPVGDWYVFYNSTYFSDWKTPAIDIIQKMKSAPYLKPLPDMSATQVPTESAAINVLVEKLTSESEDGLPATYHPSVKLSFILGWDIPDFGKNGDHVWQIHLIEISGPTMHVAWVNAENKKILFLSEQAAEAN